MVVIPSSINVEPARQKKIVYRIGGAINQVELYPIKDKNTTLI
jgi:hypothetical protein